MSNYGITISSDNFNELFLNVINQVYVKGKWTNPRGFKCKEIIAPVLILENPEKCLCTIKERKLNYAYLIIEKMMYLTQVCYPDILIAYNSKMRDYLNEADNMFDGAYGPRIARNNQLDYCYNQLKKDKDTRQAIITINDYSDRRDSKDIPCTMFLHFLIRDNRLDLITSMRSNDILWGLCLDVPAFCFLQEVMAYWLNIKTGKYIHISSSLHYYDNFEDKLLELLKPKEQNSDDGRIINLNETNNEITPKWDISYEDTKYALNLFWENEQKIRNNEKYQETGFNCIDKYIKRLQKYWQKKLLTGNK